MIGIALYGASFLLVVIVGFVLAETLFASLTVMTAVLMTLCATAAIGISMFDSSVTLRKN